MSSGENILSKLRFVTWNINSIRLRLPLLRQLVSQLKPDVIALQETKCPDELLPLDDLKALGFPHIVYNGMKGYNGVMLLSKLPLQNLKVHNRVDKNDSRHIEAALTLPDRKIILHDIYIPAGGDIPDEKANDKFAHKLDFVRELTGLFPKLHKPKDHVIAMGDFNIAPYEHDVWSHKQLLDVVSHTPVEVENLNKMLGSLKWIDAARHFTPPEEKLYSWWSYRNQDWRKSNRGRRLDHIWVTPNLEANLHQFAVEKEARDWTQPSDHVPVILDLKF
jgi:exodeoxyribonuclease-3